jgi:hypothetical protein
MLLIPVNRALTSLPRQVFLMRDSFTTFEVSIKFIDLILPRGGTLTINKSSSCDIGCSDIGLLSYKSYHTSVWVGLHFDSGILAFYTHK